MDRIHWKGVKLLTSLWSLPPQMSGQNRRAKSFLSILCPALNASLQISVALCFLVRAGMCSSLPFIMVQITSKRRLHGTGMSVNACTMLPILTYLTLKKNSWIDCKTTFISRPYYDRTVLLCLICYTKHLRRLYRIPRYSKVLLLSWPTSASFPFREHGKLPFPCNTKMCWISEKRILKG